MREGSNCFVVQVNGCKIWLQPKSGWKSWHLMTYKHGAQRQVHPHIWKQRPGNNFFLSPQAVYCWGSILERKELATLIGRAPELCGWAPWLGSVAGPCPPLVLLLAAPLNSVNSVAGPCPPLGRAPGLCQLCGWALWLGLVLLLSSSWPRP